MKLFYALFIVQTMNLLHALSKEETLKCDSMLFPMFSFLARMPFILPCIEKFSGSFNTPVKFHLPRQILSNFLYFIFQQHLIHSLVIELPPNYCYIFCSCVCLSQIISQGAEHGKEETQRAKKYGLLDHTSP